MHPYLFLEVSIYGDVFSILGPTWAHISSVSKRHSKNDSIYIKKKSDQLASYYWKTRPVDQITCSKQGNLKYIIWNV